MEEKRGHKELKIRGRIFPARRDHEGNVTRLVIDTVDQDEYFIDLNKKGKELFEFINRNVEVIGIVREDEDGNYIINVREYILMHNNHNNTRVLM